MPKSTFVINRFAVFIAMLCAAAQPALFPRPIPVLALSGHRAAIALVRAMQNPSRNDTHLYIARLVAATHPVS
jgi:hypothetical protein